MAKASETATQWNRRLEKAKKKYRDKHNAETHNQKVIRLAKKKQTHMNADTHSKKQNAKQKIQVKEEISLLPQFKLVTTILRLKLKLLQTKYVIFVRSSAILSKCQTTRFQSDLQIDKVCLTVCHCCKSHLRSNKKTPLAKAYWNHLDPGDILPEIHFKTSYISTSINLGC